MQSKEKFASVAKGPVFTAFARKLLGFRDPGLRGEVLQLRVLVSIRLKQRLEGWWGKIGSEFAPPILYSFLVDPSLLARCLHRSSMGLLPCSGSDMAV